MEQPTTDLAVPLVDLRRCTGCGECVRRCPTHAVEVIGNKAVIIRPAECTFCERCETYCPEGAIGRPFNVQFAMPLLPNPTNSC